MTPSFSIDKTQWQAQANGFWLLSFTLKLLDPTDECKTANDMIGAEYFSEHRKLDLFAAHSTALGIWQLQFLCAQQNPICTSTFTLKWRNIVLPVTADNLLLLGENLAMAPLFALAKLRQQNSFAKRTQRNLALLHATQTFPFAVKPARFMVETTPAEAIGACTLLEDWKIANRLSSEQFVAGCAQMTLSEMLESWLSAMCSIHRHDSDTSESWQLVLSASEATSEHCTRLVRELESSANTLKFEITAL
ncbi:hypothetical protein THMIRHAS_21360 [Thiosulfatimonas sediminis]|uniref:Uncharacterized protein n=1 Tax=Thiosulfatimonas sediminis TaxID=2675054 RepID=A0A6F8PX92_9GAMM|nr:hypothetical protein [Thiosulfatimonas sediminis]BBP46763.1 hypothetical protein THMIRHAS_21360 [Thiosulfatimonas sediminis]